MRIVVVDVAIGYQGAAAGLGVDEEACHILQLGDLRGGVAVIEIIVAVRPVPVVECLLFGGGRCSG